MARILFCGFKLLTFLILKPQLLSPCSMMINRKVSDLYTFAHRVSLAPLAPLVLLVKKGLGGPRGDQGPVGRTGEPGAAGLLALLVRRVPLESLVLL